MTEYYARKEYVYDGGDRILSIPFSYTDKKYIKVLINDEITSEYEYLNDSQIVVNKHLITGDIVTIVRETPIKEKFVTFTDTSILSATQQNLAQDQAFDAIQEIYDNNKVFKNETNNNLATNKQELENTIESNKQEILGIQSSFEDEVNIKIQQVSDAATKINELEEAVNTAVTAAATASEKADNAAEEVANAKTEVKNAKEEVKNAKEEVIKAKEQAQIATAKAEEVTKKVESSLTDIENKAQAEINKIQQTGFYMDNGKLYYYIDDVLENADLTNIARLGEELVDKTTAAQAAKASMPSNTVVELTLGATNSTHIAPANGYMLFSASTSAASGYVGLTRDDANIIPEIANICYCPIAGKAVSVTIPVKAGDTVRSVYDKIINAHLRFINAEGDQ